MNKKTTYKNDVKKIPKKTHSLKKTKLKQYGGRSFIATNFLPIQIHNPNGCWLEAAIQMLWCIDPVREYCISLTAVTAQTNMLLTDSDDVAFSMKGMDLFDTPDLASYNHDSRVDGITFYQGCVMQNMFLALGAIFGAYSLAVVENKLHLVDLRNITCDYIDPGNGSIVSKPSECVALIRNSLEFMGMTPYRQHDSEEFLLKLLNGLSYFKHSLNVFEEITTVTPGQKQSIDYESVASEHLNIFTDIHIPAEVLVPSSSEALADKETWIKKSLDRLLLVDMENIITQTWNKIATFISQTESVASYIKNNTAKSFVNLAEAKLAELANPNLENFEKYILDRTYIDDSDATPADTTTVDTSHILYKASKFVTLYISQKKINYINNKILEDIKYIIALGILSAIALKNRKNLSANVLQYIINNGIVIYGDSIDGDSIDGDSISDNDRRIYELLYKLLKLYIVYNEANNIKEFYLSSQKHGQIITQYDIVFDPIFRMDDADKLEEGNISEKIIKYKDLKCFKENKFLMLRINRTTSKNENGYIELYKAPERVTPDTNIDFNNNNYSLRGCILHLGEGAEVGHYVFIVYNDKGKASLTLDGATKEQPPGQIYTPEYIEKNGYVYLYEKIESAVPPASVPVASAVPGSAPVPVASVPAVPPDADADAAVKAAADADAAAEVALAAKAAEADAAAKAALAAKAAADAAAKAALAAVPPAADADAKVALAAKAADAYAKAAADADAAKVALAAKAVDAAAKAALAVKAAADADAALAAKAAASAVPPAADADAKVALAAKAADADADAAAKAAKAAADADAAAKAAKAAADADAAAKAAADKAVADKAALALAAKAAVDKAAVDKAAVDKAAVDKAAVDKAAADKAAADKAAADASDDASDDDTKARKAGKREIGRGSGSNKKKRSDDDDDDSGDSSQDNTGENVVLGVLLCITLVISTVMLL